MTQTSKTVSVLVISHSDLGWFQTPKTTIDTREMVPVDGIVGLYRDAETGRERFASRERDGNLWSGAPDCYVLEAWAKRPEDTTSLTTHIER